MPPTTAAVIWRIHKRVKKCLARGKDAGFWILLGREEAPIRKFEEFLANPGLNPRSRPIGLKPRVAIALSLLVEGKGKPPSPEAVDSIAALARRVFPGDKKSAKSLAPDVAIAHLLGWRAQESVLEADPTLSDQAWRCLKFLFFEMVETTWQNIRSDIIGLPVPWNPDPCWFAEEIWRVFMGLRPCPCTTAPRPSSRKNAARREESHLHNHLFKSWAPIGRKMLVPLMDHVLNCVRGVGGQPIAHLPTTPLWFYLRRWKQRIRVANVLQRWCAICESWTVSDVCPGCHKGTGSLLGAKMRIAEGRVIYAHENIWRETTTYKCRCGGVFEGADPHYKTCRTRVKGTSRRGRPRKVFKYVKKVPPRVPPRAKGR